MLCVFGRRKADGRIMTDEGERLQNQKWHPLINTLETPGEV